MFKFGFAAAATAMLFAALSAQAPSRGNPKTPAAAPAAANFDVFGDVNRPGKYGLKPGSRLEDALRDASGPTKQADLAHVRLIYFDKTHKTAIQQTVNLNVYIQNGNLKGNPLIAAGEVLYVPSTTHPQLIAQGHHQHL